MCGICGIFTNDRSITEHLPIVPVMTRLMMRRGPDDEGFWTDDQHLVVGFRRLAIIDPTPAGHQPMISSCGRYVIVFNGELYNFRELRARLESRGIAFRSESDTEVVLQALIVWGEDALTRFNGMFALAWYDSGNRALLLARDPMGIKPLYYLVHPQGLVFGSQYDQLLGHPFCDRSRVRMDVLGLYLRLGYIPPPYGIIANTHQLKPGSYLRITPETDSVVRTYYQFQVGEAPYLTGAEAFETTKEVILKAVKRQMVSDVPIGSFLSGGVDSPLVTAAMQKASDRPISAFTIGSTDSRFDESREANQYAQHLGVKHYLRVFSEQDCLNLIDDVAEAYSEPFADYSSFPTMLLSSITRDKVKVALSGDGADELFWGYPRFRKVLSARKYFQYPALVRLGIYGAARYSPLARVPRGIVFDTIGEWYLDAHSGLKSADLARICPGTLDYPEDFALYEFNGMPNETELAQWLRTNEVIGHLQMMLLKVDRASMYYGLEVRVPLLDLEVVEHAARIAPSECMVDGVGKIVLRKVLSCFVPEEIIPIRKSGFGVPLGDWLRKELRPLVEDLLLDNEPFPSGVLLRAGLKTLCKQHIDSITDRTQGLWNLLALQLWARKHLQRQPFAFQNLQSPPDVLHHDSTIIPS